MASKANSFVPESKEKKLETELPRPPEDASGTPDARRLWIGNLDPRVTEFALLKLLQKHGELEKFDFLYHKTGPDKGKPRGYCFATYMNEADAEKARNALHGKMALSKRLLVKQAHTEKDYDKESSSTSGVSGENTRKYHTGATIKAIEAKLMMMENQNDTFSFSAKTSTAPSTSSDVTGKGHKPYDRPKQRHS